ncbi:MAG: glucans biosynthesis glucosyltransferase MdoH, partial [Gemmatimonadaceae bacterium]|nr:glucans biosynthesis glucosyltransferase MdoH [Acetobacteraceae bacterium]
RRSYGGGARLLAGCAADAVGTLLTVPVALVSEAMFVIGLLLGHRITWTTQARDERSVPVREAFRVLWPQTTLGLAAAAWLAIVAPPALWWAGPVVLGWVLAVPYACLSASPAFGRWMRAHGLCAVPDEFDPHPILRRLEGPQVSAAKALTPAE